MAIFQYFIYSHRIVGLVTIVHRSSMTLSWTCGTLEGSEIPLVCKSGDLWGRESHDLSGLFIDAQKCLRIPSSSSKNRKL